MKYIPILFNTEMVRAIDEDHKIVTRRTKGLKTINENPDQYKFKMFSRDGYHAIFEHIDGKTDIVVKNPYGKPGDILWVKETFCLTQPFHPESYYFAYKAYNPCYPHSIDEASSKYDFETPDKWKPSIFMPKEACRIFLEVTQVRIERLQEIKEYSAIQEGVSLEEILPDKTKMYKHYDLSKGEPGYAIDAQHSFETLWRKINGFDSWKSNPWVWVIQFKKTDKPKNWPA